MKTTGIFSLLLSTILHQLSTSPARAQLVADGATNVLANVTNSITGTLTVGTNGSFTLLVLSNNVLVTNTTHGVIGRSATAKSNEVRLISASASWLMGASLFVGSNGSFNRLVVSNGAFLNNNDSFIGIGAAGSNNEVMVTGPGSFWTNRSHLYLGEFGSSGNRLVISNGALVANAAGFVGFAPSSTNNSVLVTGGGSTWSNRFAVQVGQSGNGNLLAISNGGQVISAGGNLGTFSANNLAVVTGAGSTWSNLTDLAVGFTGAGNSLVMSNGGLVSANDNIYVGATATSTNNRVIVDGGTLRANILDVRRGSNVLHAGLVEADQLLLTNTQGFFEFNGGTLITRGAAISNGLPFTVGRGSSATPAIWDARAGSSSYALGNRLIVGSNSSFNQVFITNGAVLDGSDYTFLAFSSGSNNALTVSGPGSTFNSPFGFFVGADGDANRMVVSDGGKVFANLGNAGTFIGRSIGTRSNAVTVADPGSRWSVNDTLYVGAGGNANQLVISNGATVDSLVGYVGSASSGSNNLATVTGANSVWSNRLDLNVGSGGGGNLLVASDGGLVLNRDAYVGLNSSSRSNTVLVAGVGTRWLNQTDLRLGYDGSNNQLILTNGAMLASSNAHIGFSANAGFNSALVSGAGTLWTNRDDLYVGNDGFNNQLIVSDGGTVICSNGFLSFGINSRSNLAVVTGPGSSWRNLTAFSLGRLGAGNQVVVSNGGTLQTRQSIQIGQQASSSNNTVIVTGVGSRWDSLFDGIIFGTGGGGNRLLITNGGTVLSGQNSVGLAASSINNEVLVTDAGSQWIHTSISVGQSGSRNRLVITNGGRVFGNGHVHVGENPSSTNNRVVVDGTLTITNGAGGGLLDIRRGTNVLNAGLIEADILRLTNGGLSKFEFNGGTLSVKSSRVNIGPPLIVGNGVSPATLNLAGNGTHDFSGTLGLILSNNATLTGNGSLIVQLQLLAGSQLVPGTSIGKISLSTPPSLSGATLMEISKNGAALTNDQIQVTGTLTYGGMLAVSNLGPSPLAAGDNFKPFSATSYAGSFASLTLPPLGTGLNWTNKLLVDGSIEVVTWSGPKIGSVTLSGTNLILNVTEGFPGGPWNLLTATNVALPIASWTTNHAGVFDWLGNVTLTNGVNLNEPGRYFRLSLP